MSNTEKSTRPSSADYPVDPAERSNQEARLRKAAAAGASSSKSPIPGLMLPRPAPTPQKAPEPETPLSTSADLTESAPEISNGQIGPLIANDEILAELRNISVLVNLQRKITKQALIFLMIYVPVVIGIFVLIERQSKSSAETSLPPHPSDWSEVDHNIRQGDFDKGIAIGEELILKTPQDAEAHERLAHAYLAAGKLDKAKEHYAEAFRLFPSEEHERLLSAIEKRINADKP